MFLAGTDTPSVTIEWILAELLRHSEMMHRLQSDLDRTVGTERHVRESDLANLPYLAAIVKETFRLHPVAPLLIPHESASHTQVDGYDIPATTRVFINTWAMGRDPAIWKSPSEFNPDRFIGKIPKWTSRAGISSCWRSDPGDDDALGCLWDPSCCIWQWRVSCMHSTFRCRAGCVARMWTCLRASASTESAALLRSHRATFLYHQPAS